MAIERHRWISHAQTFLKVITFFLQNRFTELLIENRYGNVNTKRANELLFLNIAIIKHFNYTFYKVIFMADSRITEKYY